MTPRDIIVIGASTGGIPALTEIASGLPRELPATLFVVVHSSPESPGLLPEIVSRAGPLPATHGLDGERFRQGRFYVASPDRHLLVDDGVIRVTRGPTENGFRPAVDPLFRTAARSHGPRVVGIVLSGALHDGSDGLQVVKRCGGVAIAQRVDDALVPSMPLHAIRNVDVDHVLAAREMPAVITRLATESVAERTDAMSTCPECGGALRETHAGKLARFDCHVGHRFTAESLMARQERTIETLRPLEEKSAVRRPSRPGARWTIPPVAECYERDAGESDVPADTVRGVLLNGERRPAATVQRKAARRGRR